MTRLAWRGSDDAVHTARVRVHMSTFYLKRCDVRCTRMCTRHTRAWPWACDGPPCADPDKDDTVDETRARLSRRRAARRAPARRPRPAPTCARESRHTRPFPPPLLSPSPLFWRK